MTGAESVMFGNMRTRTAGMHSWRAQAALCRGKTDLSHAHPPGGAICAGGPLRACLLLGKNLWHNKSTVKQNVDIFEMFVQTDRAAWERGRNTGIKINRRRFFRYENVFRYGAPEQVRRQRVFDGNRRRQAGRPKAGK
ncbi:hypothetical protein ACT6QH_01515 [Xanthobacter sp. TB0139]|uniref:hypothetical protein n=1 Tax=Xanthobacter sp. TB0139 TaxID=3459178 RepID=UPI0040399089